MIRRAVVIITLAALAAASVGCSSDESSSEPTEPQLDQATVRAESLAAIATEIIVPAYTTVAADTTRLVNELDALCASDDREATIEDVRATWSAARSSWLRTRPFRFGPATEQRLTPQIDFAIDAAKVDALIAGDAELSAASLASVGSDQRGLSGIEQAVFGDAAPDDRQCAYAAAAASIVADAAASVLRRWTESVDGAPPFVTNLTDPGAEGTMYADTHQAMSAVVNDAQFAVAEVAMKIIAPASGDKDGTPHPDEADPGRAQRARSDAVDLITAVRGVYVNGGDATPDSLGDIVEFVSADTATRIVTNLDDTLTALDALPAPLASQTDPQPAKDAFAALIATQVTMRAEVASLLGVTLNFGDADGDS